MEREAGEMPKRFKFASMVIGQVTRKNDFWKAVRVNVPELHRDPFLNLVTMILLIKLM